MAQPPRSPLHLPERYQDYGPFARGGTAAVHLVVDRSLGRPVALKVLDSSLREDPETAERFRREARVTAQLDHPNVVAVHELGPFWFSMKRVEGKTLRHMIRQGAWGAELLVEVVEVLLKVSDALAFAHDRGVIHCDLKPENIMIGRFGQVYVMDWGIARRIQEIDPSAAGTPGWMAPEQARGEACDVRTDVYGVGTLLYFALCGGRPHEAPEEDGRLELARIGDVRHPAKVNPERRMPPELVRIALRAMHPDVSMRPQTMVGLQAELRDAAQNGWWFELRRHPAGTEIIREGEPGDAAFELLEGHCDVQRGGGPIGEVSSGEVFGESALLVEGPRNATVIALTEVLLRVITREALEQELSRNRWMRSLVRSLARRFNALITEQTASIHPPGATISK